MVHSCLLIIKVFKEDAIDKNFVHVCRFYIYRTECERTETSGGELIAVKVFCFAVDTVHFRLEVSNFTKIFPRPENTIQCGRLNGIFFR